MPDPRRATDTEVPGLARLLAAAFAEDPVFAHLLPPSMSRRDDRMVRCFALDTARSHGLGATWVHDDDGAAVWFPPGRALESAWEQFRSVPAYVRIFGRRLMIASHVASTMARHHPRVPHWYLLYIGVAPKAQGTGVGTALLTAMLAECDARGEAAYLEATTEHSRKLYARHGFVDGEPLHLPDGGPQMYPMWRDPE